MLRRTFVLSSGAAALTAADRFVPLFNGKNLDGWDGDPKLWTVRDGMIVGSTEGQTLQTNQFLVTKKTYRNFVLRTQAKLRNHNSGIQFRSELLPNWVARGYQVDMGESNYWGNIYEEKGTRGIMVDTFKEIGQKVVRMGDWNDIEISCKGDDMQVKLNGTVTAKLTDSKWPEGVIGLQLHRGPAMEAYFRKIEIQVLG